MRFRLTYYPDITQHRTPEEVRTAVMVFAAALARSLSAAGKSSVEVEVLPVASVRDQTQMISGGDCEIALIKPSSYVIAHRRNPQVLPAAVALREIDGKPGDAYFSQIYANTRSGITSFDELRARCLSAELQRRPTIGFGDPFSTANFLVPAARLLELGLHPFTRFRRTQFCGGHDGVAKAVYSGELEVGAGHDGVILDLARQPGFADAGDRLKRLDRMFIHSDPVAVNVADPIREQIVKSLIEIEADPEIKKALDVFWGAVVGLARSRHENYASVEQAIDRLGIPENDILV